MAKPKGGGALGSDARNTWFVRKLEEAASVTLQLPGDVLIAGDVYASLLKAMNPRDDPKIHIEWDTVPSGEPFEFDEGAWGGCLATLAVILRSRRSGAYSFYRHLPKYAAATLDKPISEIVSYLTNAVIEQSKALGS